MARPAAVQAEDARWLALLAAPEARGNGTKKAGENGRGARWFMTVSFAPIPRDSLSQSPPYRSRPMVGVMSAPPGLAPYLCRYCSKRETSREKLIFSVLGEMAMGLPTIL